VTDATTTMRGVVAAVSAALCRKLRATPAVGGFTLPEVTIAVAVCMVGMVGVLSLLPNALHSSRSAMDHTISARIAEEEFTYYRAAASARTLATWPPGAGAINRPPWSGASATRATHYYDFDGNPCRLEDEACRFLVLINVSTNRPGQIVDLRVSIRWPYRTAGGRTGYETRNITSNLFVTSVARYDRP